MGVEQQKGHIESDAYKIRNAGGIITAGGLIPGFGFLIPIGLTMVVGGEAVGYGLKNWRESHQ